MKRSEGKWRDEMKLEGLADGGELGMQQSAHQW